jgi:hypothetical protein
MRVEALARVAQINTQQGEPEFAFGVDVCESIERGRFPLE